MNTKAEVVQAFEDYQAGRLGTIPAARSEVPHGEVPHGEVPHGEVPHGEVPHGG